MPNASVRTTITVKAGVWTRVRTAKRRSWDIRSEYYVQFGRKDRIVRSHKRRDTRRMNTMPAETGPAKAARYVQNEAREQLNDLARWNAVVEHDRGVDGLFVYAVR